jgi:aminopeptidase N
LSLAIGPWKRLSDSYEGKPVDYFIDKNVDDAVALRTFHLTPDMIGFFSRATGVEYPFEKDDPSRRAGGNPKWCLSGARYGVLPG